MRFFALLSGVAALTAGSVIGVIPTQALAATSNPTGTPANTDARGGAAPASPLFTWRFMGTARLNSDTNASRIRAVLAEPASRRVFTNAVLKFARSSALWGRAAGSPTSDPAVALRPVLEELIRAESVGVCTLTADRKVDWAIAVRSGAPLRQLTPSVWAGLVAAQGASAPTTVTAGGLPLQEARWPNSTAWSRWGQAQGWTLFGLGGGSPRGFDALLAEIAAAESTGSWLNLRIDLPQIARIFDWSDAPRFPSADLGFVGRGENVRIAARLVYPQPLNLKLEPWRIPTNTVHDPLVGFTAVQGLEGWLGRQTWWRELGLPHTPNQVFGWAMAQVPFATYYAWQLPDVTNVLRQLAPSVPAFLTNQLPRITHGHVGYQTNSSRIVWFQLPVAEPFLAACDPRDPGFVMAGVFPTAHYKRPMPTALYTQVAGRNDLVYYDWEITQERVDGWRHIKNLARMLSGYLPPTTNDVGEVWLTDTNVTRNLGNCVTEVTQQSPRELALVRSAPVGLTGFELILLMRWLDDPAFPLLSALPDNPIRTRRARPTDRSATNPAALKPAVTQPAPAKPMATNRPPARPAVTNRPAARPAAIRPAGATPAATNRVPTRRTPQPPAPTNSAATSSSPPQ